MDDRFGGRMTFGTFLETMKRNGLGLCVEGFINIESGTASVSTRIFDTTECDCFDSGLGVPEVECEVCLRGPGNFVSCASGSGDGVYAILGIYPIADPRKRLGAMAVFDWGYEIANKARARVEMAGPLGFHPEELSSMGGNGLDFSTDDLESFEDTKPVLHGNFRSVGPVFFSDDSGHRNGNYAIVDVQLNSNDLDVLIFGAEKDPYQESLSWEGSGSEAEIIKSTMFEALGLTPSEPTYFPQILMVLDSTAARLFDFSDQLPMTDWASSGVHAMSRMGTSHLEPQHVSTYWVNALLSRAKFRLTLLRDENAEDPGDSDVLRQFVSWALLGEISGDSDATTLIDELGARDLVSEPEYRAAVLNLRGWDDYPAPSRKEATTFSKSSEAENSGSGLTKSSNKSGLGLEEFEPQITKKSASNFCSNCGSKFETEVAKFCQNCGSQRL